MLEWRKQGFGTCPYCPASGTLMVCENEHRRLQPMCMMCVGKIDKLHREPPAEIKGLGLWQPYASLMWGGWKEHETRHWATPYRGWTVIYATQNFPEEEMDEARFIAVLHTREQLRDVSDRCFYWSNLDSKFGLSV